MIAEYFPQPQDSSLYWFQILESGQKKRVLLLPEFQGATWKDSVAWSYFCLELKENQSGRLLRVATATQEADLLVIFHKTW